VGEVVIGVVEDEVVLANVGVEFEDIDEEAVAVTVVELDVVIIGRLVVVVEDDVVTVVAVVEV
jgi:hypothetical protein